MATYYFSDVVDKSGDGSCSSPFALEDLKEVIRKIVAVQAELPLVEIVKRLD